MEKVKFERRPLAGTDATRYMLDCPHGTTYATVIDGAGWGEEKTERLAIQALVAKHEDQEACGCAIGWLRDRLPARGV
jgi:hypothetical protein